VNGDMTEIGSDPANPEDERHSEPEEPARSRGSAWGVLAFVLALAALLGTGWLWWQGQSAGGIESERLDSELARLASTDNRLADRLVDVSGELESLSAAVAADSAEEFRLRWSESQAAIDALSSSLQEQAALVSSLQSAADATHGRLLAAEASLAELSARKLDARAALDLAEVDYLLRLATERLQLFADPLAADRALALADAHLAALDNPAHLAVRQAIASARADLDVIDVPDYLALSGQLEALQKSVPSLPFRDAPPAATSNAPVDDADWWEKLKSTLASLVTVRRSTEEENRRVSLQDKDYIRQRIWLQLEVANLGLMRHDQAGFTGALQRVQASVAEWFEPASADVREFSAALAALLELNIAITWPDISAPWTALRLVRSTPPAAGPVVKPADGSGEPADPEAASAEAAGENDQDEDR